MSRTHHDDDTSQWLSGTHHGDDADQHGPQRRADGHGHDHEAEVEEEQVDAHQELGGHEADVVHKVRQDAQQQHQQHEYEDDEALYDAPGYRHFWVQLSARAGKNASYRRSYWKDAIIALFRQGSF